MKCELKLIKEDVKQFSRWNWLVIALLTIPLGVLFDFLPWYTRYLALAIVASLVYPLAKERCKAKGKE